jgi:hypothetical protein
MSVADIVLGPTVWGVPPLKTISLFGIIRRRIYCYKHGDKLRIFFLGMLASDTTMSPEDKLGYYAWLEKVNWAQFLAKVRDVAHWKKVVFEEHNPIDATLLEGVNGEYQRLYRCYQSDSRKC